MKTSIEKFNAGVNDMIQIIVSRACSLFFCSDCTELLPFRGHHGTTYDPIDMSLDVFREACRSLAGWPGKYSLFGGNPCNHKRFPELLEIYRAEVPDIRQRCLFSNDLNGHGAIVVETFLPTLPYLNLNLHCNTKPLAEMEAHVPRGVIRPSIDRPSWHSPILMRYADYGITDAEWPAIRETCDMNLRWSAAIAERNGKPYVWFCETAQALDAVTGVNHGLPATPGWWRQDINHFADQVDKCCRDCGVPLSRKGHRDADDTYDYSPSYQGLVELTVKARSRLKTQRHDSLSDGTEAMEEVPRPTNYLRLGVKP